MKRVDASRPGLSLPIRLSILALATIGGVVGVAAVLAKQNGTDVISSLSTLDFAKAYRQENINYTLAGVKLKLGDRKGAAALVKTLKFDQGSETYLGYTELRTNLVKAQIAAGEFDEALRSSQKDQALHFEVTSLENKSQGLDAVLQTVSTLPEPDRSRVLAGLATEYAGNGDLVVAERVVAQLIPSERDGSYSNLGAAYYKAGQLEIALTTLQRITDKSHLESALASLGNACLIAKDAAGLRRVLALLPLKPTVRTVVRVSQNTASTSVTQSSRQQLLQQSINMLDSPEKALELVRDFAHPLDQRELLRNLGSVARSTRDSKTAYGILALLRQDTSQEGRQAYDQEAQMLLNGDLETLSDPLPLAESIQDSGMRLSALLTLAQRAKTVNQLQPILLALRKLPEGASQHDYSLLMFLNRVEQQSPAQAKALAQQFLDPERRKQVLASLAARHP